MKITHTVPRAGTADYTMIPNAIIEDHRPSGSARGLLIYLLCIDEGEEVDLSTMRPDLEDETVEESLIALEHFGYISRDGDTITTFRDGGAA